MVVELKKAGRNWQSYLAIIGLVLLLVVLPVAALLYFEEEIKQASGYGYVGVFIVGLLCGITIIPAPTQLLVFTFGGVLNPIWVGIIAGFGSGLGGITVYLTGAGAQNIWARLRNKEQAFEKRLGIVDDKASLERSRLWAKWKAFYGKMEGWINGKQGAWALFLTSALVISPFYPAGLAAGSLRMGLLKFFLISWAGRTVRYLSVALAGYYGLGFISNLLR
ncbi:MAG: VTT domain-containing protein [Chloroflexi bacterium]|nr:VTT domain-containing protein [Chloroflexota bacterium]